MTSPLSSLDQVRVDRRSALGRRQAGNDRRQENITVGEERRQGERRKVPRRRQIDPTTCERDYSAEEIEFMQAMDAYKRRSGRMFPTCSEILEVILALGYAKTPAVPEAPATPELQATPAVEPLPAAMSAEPAATPASSFGLPA